MRSPPTRSSGWPIRVRSPHPRRLANARRHSSRTARRIGGTVVRRTLRRNRRARRVDRAAQLITPCASPSRKDPQHKHEGDKADLGAGAKSADTRPSGAPWTTQRSVPPAARRTGFRRQSFPRPPARPVVCRVRDWRPRHAAVIPMADHRAEHDGQRRGHRQIDRRCRRRAAAGEAICGPRNSSIGTISDAQSARRCRASASRACA